MEITDSDWFSLTVFVNSFFSFSFFLFFCSLFVKWIMRNAPACSNLFAVLAKYPSEDSPNLWVSLIPNSLLSVPPSLSLSLFLSFSLSLSFSFCSPFPVLHTSSDLIYK